MRASWLRKSAKEVSGFGFGVRGSGLGLKALGSREWGVLMYQDLYRAYKGMLRPRKIPASSFR